jgi:hypothetical protein
MDSGSIASPRRAGLGLLGRGIAMAGTGALAGAVPSIVRGDNASTVTGNTLLGAGLGAAGEGVGSAVAGAGGKLANAILNRNVVAPEASALKATSGGQYNAIRGDQSALLSNPHISDMSQGIQDQLATSGLDIKGPATIDLGGRSGTTDALQTDGGGVQSLS